jgi:MoxR-like ATPase
MQWLKYLKQAVTVEELINMQNKVKEVFVSEDMAKYIVIIISLSLPLITFLTSFKTDLNSFIFSP